MTVKTIARNLMLGLSLMQAPAALAEDAAAPAPKPKNTITIETSPEFYAIDSAGKYSSGDLASEYLKLGFSHSFDNGFAVSAGLQLNKREPNTAGAGSAWNAIEIGTSYKYKLNSTLSITPAVLVGYGFGDQPKINPADPSESAAYYAISAALDWKFAPQFTWNVLNVRYRDAFDYTWKTPKISTGVTYNIDGANAVYMNVGKSWKDTGNGAGYVEDKVNVAIGFKHSF